MRINITLYKLFKPEVIEMFPFRIIHTARQHSNGTARVRDIEQKVWYCVNYKCPSTPCSGDQFGIVKNFFCFRNLQSLWFAKKQAQLIKQYCKWSNYTSKNKLSRTNAKLSNNGTTWNITQARTCFLTSPWILFQRRVQIMILNYCQNLEW